MKKIRVKVGKLRQMIKEESLKEQTADQMIDGLINLKLLKDFKEVVSHITELLITDNEFDAVDIAKYLNGVALKEIKKFTE